MKKEILILAGVGAAIYFLSKKQTVNGIGRVDNSQVNMYILNAIDSDSYDIKTTTAKEKLQFLADTFKSEYGFNIKRIGYQRAMAEWISGLPSSFNIDFENWKIIELAKEWGSLPKNPTERQEDKIIDNFFNFIAAKTIMLMRRNKIEF
jgi:hypothetical protein